MVGVSSVAGPRAWRLERGQVTINKEYTAPQSTRSMIAGASRMLIRLSAVAGTTGGQLLGESVANDVGGELGRALHAHLLEDARPIRAHRLDAQCQIRGDLARGFAGGDHPHDLILTIGQCLVQRCVGVSRQMIGKFLGYAQGQVPTAGDGLPDGVDQLGGCAFPS